MSHSFERLCEHILPLSKATDFNAAKREWELAGIELHEEMTHCPCGQEIKEMCFIRNAITHATTHVGNVCIQRFIGIDTGNTFAGLRRIASNLSANANEDLIIHAHQLGFIYENEYSFLMDTRNKRNLSSKQLHWKEKINRRILSKTVVRSRLP